MSSQLFKDLMEGLAEVAEMENKPELANKIRNEANGLLTESFHSTEDLTFRELRDAPIGSIISLKIPAWQGKLVNGENAYKKIDDETFVVLGEDGKPDDSFREQSITDVYYGILDLDEMSEYQIEEPTIKYVIVDRNGKKRSSPNEDDQELWDRVESMDPRGDKGLMVVVYDDSLDEKLVKKGSKWQAQSEKGRSFGTYDTKGEAQERLKQMEMFKHMNEGVDPEDIGYNDWWDFYDLEELEEITDELSLCEFDGKYYIADMVNGELIEGPIDSLEDAKALANDTRAYFTESFKLRESDEVNAMMDLMHSNDELKDDPYVGSFWYDPNSDELFGVYSTLASDTQFSNSKLFDQKVRTGRKLHKDIWRKEQYKKKDNRFSGDHTLVPRGRVFQLEDGTFEVMVGDWIDDYPQAKEEIIFEFQLPEDTKFVKDEHWNLGRGFSDEFLEEKDTDSLTEDRKSDIEATLLDDEPTFAEYMQAHYGIDIYDDEIAENPDVEDHYLNEYESYLDHLYDLPETNPEKGPELDVDLDFDSDYEVNPEDFLQAYELTRDMSEEEAWDTISQRFDNEKDLGMWDEETVSDAKKEVFDFWKEIKLNEDFDPDEHTKTCPECLGDLTFVGYQGNVAEFRCDDCGSYYYMEPDSDELISSDELDKKHLTEATNNLYHFKITGPVRKQRGWSADDEPTVFVTGICDELKGSRGFRDGTHEFTESELERVGAKIGDTIACRVDWETDYDGHLELEVDVVKKVNESLNEAEDESESLLDILKQNPLILLVDDIDAYSGDWVNKEYEKDYWDEDDLDESAEEPNEHKRIVVSKEDVDSVIQNIQSSNNIKILNRGKNKAFAQKFELSEDDQLGIIKSLAAGDYAYSTISDNELHEGAVLTIFFKDVTIDDKVTDVTVYIKVDDSVAGNVVVISLHEGKDKSEHPYKEALNEAAVDQWFIVKTPNGRTKDGQTKWYISVQRNGAGSKFDQSNVPTEVTTWGAHNERIVRVGRDRLMGIFDSKDQAIQVAKSIIDANDNFFSDLNESLDEAAPRKNIKAEFFYNGSNTPDDTIYFRTVKEAKQSCDTKIEEDAEIGLSKIIVRYNYSEGFINIWSNDRGWLYNWSNKALDEAKNDTLNQDIWDGDELRPEVREKLELIVDKFIDALKADNVDLDVADVQIVGSNANYNYTPYSDIDLHLIVNLDIYKDKEDLAQIIYNAYRRLFNDKFDPMIRGHEVEIYVEPLEGAETSEGLEEGVMKVKKYIAEAGSSRYNPQYTAREVARDVKAKVDDLVRELVDKYGMKVIKSATVMNVFEKEPAMALMDLEAEGKVLTNAERWQ